MEDSPDSTSVIRDPHSEIREGASPSEASGKPIQNRKSKSQNSEQAYVVTPRRRAAMLANLEKARAAPKEKVYRPSEKRRAANQANLEKAHAARAAARAEQQAFCERFERLFPPFALGNPSTIAEGGEAARAAGIERVREVAERVWQRRRFYPRQARREGRKVMRLLTAAAERPTPASMEEAFQLLRQLLEIFLRSRAVGQAEHLNAQIERLLLEMLEERYGREVFLNGFPMATALREIEADVKRQAAEDKAEREARRALRQAQAPPEEAVESEQGEAAAEAPPEPVPPPGNSAPAQAAPPVRKVPELPEEFEDFLEIFCRAFPPPSRGQATEGDQVLLHSLAQTVWERLHVYEWQIKLEEAELQRVVEELGAEAVESYKDLRARSYRIESAFAADPEFRKVTACLEEYIELGINRLLEWRYGSDVQQEIFPPPPGITVPATSTWGRVGSQQATGEMDWDGAIGQ